MVESITGATAQRGRQTCDCIQQPGCPGQGGGDCGCRSRIDRDLLPLPAAAFEFQSRCHGDERERSADGVVDEACYPYLPGDQVASVGRLDSSFYLQNILLRDSDVFGMANSLEIRVPFLGRDLAEWALGLPGNVLLPRGAPQKYLLRKICASLYTSAQSKQPKRGFALPFAAWLQGPLRELMEENLRSLRLSGLLDPRGIDRLRKMFDMEPNGPAWSRVWALVVLGTWLQKQQRLMPNNAVPA